MALRPYGREFTDPDVDGVAADLHFTEAMKMTNLKKLGLAVGLALAAAVLNVIWLSAEKKPTFYVSVAAEVPAGTPITDDLLTPIAVPGRLDQLRATLVPYANRAVLFGMAATRTYAAGDIVFQRDIQAPSELSEFAVLGPFRLISVGERFKRTDDDSDELTVDPSGNNVTIAVDANFDEKTRRLLEIVNPHRSHQSSAGIVAVQVIPEDDYQATDVATDDADDNIVYQTISLAGIENVPRVLLAGEVIRFVIPAETAL